MVHPDGSVSQASGIFEPAYLEEELPLREGRTFAVRYGSILQWLMTIIGTACALLAVYFTSFTTRSSTPRLKPQGAKN